MTCASDVRDVLGRLRCIDDFRVAAPTSRRAQTWFAALRCLLERVLARSSRRAVMLEAMLGLLPLGL